MNGQSYENSSDQVADGRKFLDCPDGTVRASEHAGRNRVITDAGEFTTTSERLILDADIPWLTPGISDVDSFPRGLPMKRAAVRT